MDNIGDTSNKARFSTTDYYIRAFNRLKSENKDTWNWSAAIFGSGWLLYRKMYFWAILFAITDTLIWIIIYNLGGRILIAWILNAVFDMGILGYFGNRLYYNSVNHKISNGYHLLKNYHPYSIFAVVALVFLHGTGFHSDSVVVVDALIDVLSIIILATLLGCADWFANRKNTAGASPTDDTYRQYFIYTPRNHIPGIIASILSGFCVLILASSQPTIKDFKSEKMQKIIKETQIVPTDTDEKPTSQENSVSENTK